MKLKHVIDKLKAPFGVEQVKWKVQATKGAWTTFVAYVDARAVVSRLNDATDGLWQDQYSEVGGLLMCRIGIYDQDSNQWLWRQDTGIESREEKEKGHASDAFKRASVKWGLGHDLYNNMPIIKANNKAQDWKGNPCAAGFDGKPISNATDFCNKLIADNKNKDIIFFEYKDNNRQQSQQPQQPQTQKPWFNPLTKDGAVTKQGLAWQKAATEKGKQEAIRLAKEKYRVSVVTLEWMNNFNN